MIIANNNSTIISNLLFYDLEFYQFLGASYHRPHLKLIKLFKFQVLLVPA
jgi:hypothetical protein